MYRGAQPPLKDSSKTKAQLIEELTELRNADASGLREAWDRAERVYFVRDNGATFYFTPPTAAPASEVYQTEFES